MRFNWFKLGSCLLPTIVTLALSASPVAAADPVQITMGGTGTTPWSIGNIKPGDSGTQSLTIQNTGTDSGNLTIWVSNIVETEGTPIDFEPVPGTIGELGNYLTFTVASARFSSNIIMPALIGNLPQSVSDTDYLKVLTLTAGETVTLNWNWSLPAGTGNIVQGDGLSFDINYLLEQVVPPYHYDNASHHNNCAAHHRTMVVASLFTLAASYFQPSDNGYNAACNNHGDTHDCNLNGNNFNTRDDNDSTSPEAYYSAADNHGRNDNAINYYTTDNHNPANNLYINAGAAFRR